MSNFGFLQAEWPELYGEAMRAERLAIADPRTSCFYARRAVELALNWLYQADDTLREPYRRDLSAMINEPTLVNLVGPALRTKMDVIRRQGNLAVHSTKPVQSKDAIRSVAELFHVMYWLARNYARNEANVPPSSLGFDASRIPVPQSCRGPAEEARRVAGDGEAGRRSAGRTGQGAAAQPRPRTMKCSAYGKKSRLPKRPMTGGATRTTTARPRPGSTSSTSCSVRPDGSLDKAEDREYPVAGLPSTKSGQGKVDYVLWDDDGRPLGRRGSQGDKQIADSRTGAGAGSTRTRLSVSSAHVRSSSTPTGTRPGSGTTATGTRPGRSRASTRRTNCVR